MIYSHKSPALLIIGIVMLLWGWMNNAGTLDGMQGWLHPGAYKEHAQAAEKHAADTKAAAEKAAAEGQPAPEAKPMKPSKFDGTKAGQAQLAYILGGLFTAVGVLVLVLPKKEGHLDYYAGVVPGMAFIVGIACAVRWLLDPMFANWGKAAQPTLGWDFAKIMNLNYVVLGIVLGMIIVNLLRIPAWAANGVRTARLFLKTGVVLLGTLYSAAELAQLGALSVVMIGIFVLGSVWLVLLAGPRMGASNSMTGVLSSGVGVCGVSAAVAASPVVNAKAVDIAFTLGTILLWGVLCMFTFPTVGQLLGMGPVQFGAWAGTGILNSAQVAGAALAFDPQGIETLKVAEIFNITRVLFLPIIVVWLAAWYVKREAGAQKVDLGKVLVAKFPVFVLGFLFMFLLSTLGMFAPPGHYQGKYFSSEQVKEDKLLKEKEIAALQAYLPKLTKPEETKALQDLIANRKLTSREQDHVLKGVSKAAKDDKAVKEAVGAANKAAWHDSKIIRAFRDWIAWLFAIGLTGLGMQITVASIKQAGGKPLIIGSVVGIIKAVGSLIVVLLFVKEFV
ncbi:MAG: putative sulfate exporter family transporter [Rhodocyclaceae bacterium]|nr:putative sulfate exporter family transporter [Rhodocyclaceae bacterium]HNQ56581.1 putative sulfate exporter family transporter [Candidatus Desulfobacillus denitrificans]HNT62073.1 putative sulfate exporter family transporter [Candidatus Desulfobacillus denitrificans]